MLEHPEAGQGVTLIMDMIPQSMPALPGIYIIVNTVNQHRYVGSAKNLLHRQQHHLRDLQTGIHKNDHLQCAYDLYGADSFRFDVLEVVEHVEDLLMREQHYIDTLNPEYNIARTAGSNLGMTYSPETKAKMSAARRSHPRMLDQMAKLNADRTGKPLGPEHRAKISAVQVGKTLSPEHKAKISVAHRGKKKTPEHAAKIRAAKLGKPRDAQTIEKMAAARRGKKQSPELVEKRVAPLRGKKRSPEVHAKISATKRAKKLAKLQVEQPPLF